MLRDGDAVGDTGRWGQSAGRHGSRDTGLVDRCVLRACAPRLRFLAKARGMAQVPRGPTPTSSSATSSSVCHGSILVNSMKPKTLDSRANLLDLSVHES